MPFFPIASVSPARILSLTSPDGTNRLTRACVLALTAVIAEWRGEVKDELKNQHRPPIITGSRRFFPGGADLSEIAALTGPQSL
jgi:enoyl-CoA hydratase/carnithine racemase